MAFAADFAFHEERRRRIVDRFRHGNTLIRVAAERAAEQSGKHFVEFYDRGEASKTGLLLTAAEYWVIVVTDSILAITVERMRFWCYREWGFRPIRGGDDKQFWGVLIPLTRVVSLSTELITDNQREEIRRITSRLIVTPPPITANDELFGQ